MRIGFSTFVMQGGKSGIAAYIRDLIRALQQTDFQNQYELLMARNEADLIPLSNPRFSKRLSASWINRPIPNLLWHNLVLPQARYDLLHIPSYRRIPRLKRTRVVATVHDLATFHVDGKYDRARMFFNRRLVPGMIHNADHVITVSQHTKNDLVELIGYPEERISVIYSGIDHNRFFPQQGAAEKLQAKHGLDKPFFVYVSRLEHPAKNHIRLIEAFEQFKLNNDSGHQLLLVGADWNGAELIRARAAQSPVKDDIRFLGFVPPDTLPLLYRACDLMIYPSLFEGFGFPILEALACGAPVICSNTSSMREIATDHAATFDPTCVEELVETMERTLAEGRNAEQRQRALAYTRTFDWSTTARRVQSVYENLA